MASLTINPTIVCISNMNCIKELFSKPFKEHLLFMVALFVFIASPCVLLQIRLGNNYYSLFLAIHCFLLSYLLTLFVSLTRPRFIRKIIQALLILVSIVYFGINLYSLNELDGLIDEDYLMLAINTNPNEAVEFLMTSLPIRILIRMIGILGAFIVLWCLSFHYNLNLGKKSSQLAICFCVICLAINIRNWVIWRDGPVNHISELLCSTRDYELPNDLKFNQTNPKISIYDNSTDLPANVVLIIGESFARYHSSLYGYDKLTNPCLSSLRDKSMLFLFDSIDAPASTTSISLKFMLSEYSKNDKDLPKKWYEYTTIIEMMNRCGYESYWVSNQARAGKYNYIGRFFAESCDRCWFLQENTGLYNNKAYDSVLVDSTSIFINDISDDKHHFIVYHMLGSHFEYSRRYPEEFAQFSENDYMNNPNQDQREIIASYDNSILYNDYVVDQIIKLYRNTESIILYVPDHGEDLFYSSPDYHFHGKTNNPASYAYGVKIPFMIYASQKFQDKYPATINRIMNRQNNPIFWDCDDLPYLIMDLIGAKNVNGKNVREKSILSSE